MSPCTWGLFCLVTLKASVHFSHKWTGANLRLRFSFVRDNIGRTTKGIGMSSSAGRARTWGESVGTGHVEFFNPKASRGTNGSGGSGRNVYVRERFSRGDWAGVTIKFTPPNDQAAANRIWREVRSRICNADVVGGLTEGRPAILEPGQGFELVLALVLGCGGKVKVIEGQIPAKFMPRWRR